MNLFFLSLPFLAKSFCPYWECPPAEDVFPCSCRKLQYFGRAVTCNNLNSSTELTRVLQNIKGCDLIIFELQNSSIQHIPKNAFNGVRFNRMDISNVSFTHLFEDVPQDPGVLMMIFKKVHVVGSWDWSPFSAFAKLDTIEMQGIKLNGLSDFRQYAPGILKEIIFDRCEVKELQKDEFQDFSELKKISIINDKIKDLKRSMFPMPSKIVKMVFRSNQISTIPEDLFEGMKLSVLDFSDNQIMALPENICKSLPYLFLSFADNPLRCDCAMKWILTCYRRVFDGTCASPENMKGKRLHYLKEDDFEYC